ncbi:glycoside hydrolase family 65 protein [Tetragenococcus halophilus]|uniref:glycoside hydrolase family 65 protein n=1 Tax=Tetragenococcus halophilus TaxID=51669 RepID=UPI000B9298FD|nr:glycoside hydrolase family 65 protein [Tetragenococcus halophilus]
MYKRLFDVDPWKIKTNQLDKTNKRLQESLTSIGNGYMGMRGNFEEAYSGDTHRGTYIAGVWYPDKTRVGWWKNGYPEYFGKVINAMNFLSMEIQIDGVELDLATNKVENFYLELDMKNGLLTRSFIYHKDDVNIKFEFQRFLSIVQKELCFIQLQIEVLSGNPELVIKSGINGNVKNEDSNYNEMFWEEKQCEVKENHLFLTTETIKNDFNVPRYSVTGMVEHSYSNDFNTTFETKSMQSSEVFSAVLTAGTKVELEKKIAVITSRDIPEEQHVKAAEDILNNYKNETFAQHLARQIEKWRQRWKQADIEISGDDEAQQGIRFNLFQLFSTYYGEDERLNIGPKGFTGEKYGGATYWDTEAYAVPVYLAVAKPEVTKNLLKYRYNQLEGAYLNAQRQGLKGALYPMVTFTGVECHNEWEITFEEIHRNGAMVYAIYNYTTYTGDESYLKNEGLEVIVAVARFWADRVHYSKRNECYMIHGVTGPNEYENNVNNNWYTNTLAVWVLRYAIENLVKYPERQEELDVTEEELAQWKKIVKNMYLPYDEKNKIFIQHDTFLDKDIQPVTNLSEDELPINQNWSWDKILRSCFIKQADVLQGIYFFGDQFTQKEKERNFNFYEPLTVHESSLSASVHAVLAAELGKEEKAVEMYQRTARLDLDNYNNDTQDGLHVTSMTGSWLAIVQGFAGMRTNNGLSFQPFLPKNWEGYNFRVNYQGRLIAINVDTKMTQVDLIEGEDLEITISGSKKLLSVNK